MTKQRIAKIRNTFTYLNFKKWLKNNVHRFNIRPYFSKISSHSFQLRFHDVPAIEIDFGMSGVINVWIIKDNIDNIKRGGHPDNLLTDFFLAEKKDSKGYYCSFCEKPVYFNNRHDLWVDHIYELILEWANKKLVSDNFLCIYADEGEVHWSGSNILSSAQIEKDVMFRHRFFCKPVLTSNGLK